MKQALIKDVLTVATLACYSALLVVLSRWVWNRFRNRP